MGTPSPAGIVRVAAPAALAMGAVLLATSGRYGLHGDELYFRMLPWAWWYDDQPPMTVWLSRLAGLGGAAWLQRVPAILAAMAGVLLAAAGPRLLGHPARVQRVAAWAHATTVYPLLVGHVFLTASIDLVVWQAVILLVLRGIQGRPSALAWAGAVAGLGCWNKLLVMVLVAGLVVALAASHPRLLCTRGALTGLVALAVLAGPQVAAQLWHGLPMSAVSADLIARHGASTRWFVVPLVLIFIGPPYVRVLWRGLSWGPRMSERCRRPGAHGLGVPVLAVVAALVTGFTVLFPAQPYYPVAAFLPALSIGWGAAAEADWALWRRRWVVVGANAVVSLLVCLPLAPTSSTVFRLVSAVNPVQRDQAGWDGYVQQISAARGRSQATVVTDFYALAGAVAFYGPTRGIPADRVASGHNALSGSGPPSTESVLLVGERSAGLRHLFARCVDVGTLARGESDPFGVAGAPLVRCDSPSGGWARVWPAFRFHGA